LALVAALTLAAAPDGDVGAGAAVLVAALSLAAAADGDIGAWSAPVEVLLAPGADALGGSRGRDDAAAGLRDGKAVMPGATRVYQRICGC
jgi:hypothetical protein